MKRIVVGGRQEYIRRLTDYLMRQLPAHIRIYSFTKPDHLPEHRDKVDLYVLEEEFCEELKALEYDLNETPCILIRDQLSDHAYCRWENPGKLFHMIESMLYLEQKKSEKSEDGSRLIGLYAPSAGLSLKDFIWPEMKPGNLYLGFQDIGAPDESSDMAELSYYINLREESILSELDRLSHPCEGRYYLDSSRWFFDYLGLNEEDFLWFFQILKNQSDYSDIYIGFNNSLVPSLSFFQIFDRLILVDQPEYTRVNYFCEKLQRTLVEEGIMKKESIKRLDGSQYS